MRLRGHGHPEIRATHANTFELSPDADIGRAATCVVAAGSRPVPAEVRPFAGPVRLDLTVGRHSVTVHAAGNPQWVPGGPAVVRRSAVRLPNTLATDADLASSELPRELVAALADPAAVVELTVTQQPRSADGRAGLVLLSSGTACASRSCCRPDGDRPAGCRVAVEAAAATVVVAEDDGAGQLLVAHGVTWVRAGDAAAVGAAVEAGGRVLVVATDDLPGGSVAEHLARPDAVAVEVVGLPGPLAVAAASASRAPLVVATGERADAGRLLRSTPAGHRLVVRVPASALDKLARSAGQHRGAPAMVVARTPYGLYERPLGYRDGLMLSGEVLCCIEPGPAAAGLDPSEVRLVAALLADGVPTRTVARAVSELTGRPRRDAYQAVLDLAASTPRP